MSYPKRSWLISANSPDIVDIYYSFIIITVNKKDVKLIKINIKIEYLADIR